MSKVIIAKQPNLSFLLTSSRRGEVDNCLLPIILKADGSFDWNANSFLTEYGGGNEIYNIKPLAITTAKKAYNLNIFTNFLEKNNTNPCDINDSSLYVFIDYLKNRGINDETILSHGRTALSYIVHLDKIHPDWNLATNTKKTEKSHQVHYSITKLNRAGREIQYLEHSSFKGLIHISEEIDFIRDDELIMWIDAINCTTFHPQVNSFLLSRWQAFTTLLEITGSRISEVHKISRKMVKEAALSLLHSHKPPIIREIPILKGKYKGKKRQAKTTSEDLQVILWHIDLVEDKFPNLNHDSIFIDFRTGAPLKASYLKNYAKKVINGSKYCRELRHLNNHSFRHRYITLHVGKAIKRMSESGSFSNILDVAATACRKVTMHASNQTLSQYIHLASEYNNDLDPEAFAISSQIKLRVRKMIGIADSLRAKDLDSKEALDSLISILDEFSKMKL